MTFLTPLKSLPNSSYDLNQSPGKGWSKIEAGLKVTLSTSFTIRRSRLSSADSVQFIKRFRGHRLGKRTERDACILGRSSSSLSWTTAFENIRYKERDRSRDSQERRLSVLIDEKNPERSPVKTFDLYCINYTCTIITQPQFTCLLSICFTVTSTDSSMIINSSKIFESKVDFPKTDYRMGRIDVFDV